MGWEPPVPTYQPGRGLRDTQQQSWRSTEDHATAPRQCQAWAERVGATGPKVWGRKGFCFVGGLVTLEVLDL